MRRASSQSETALPLDGSADGSHCLWVWATDRAGNTSSTVEAAFTLDATAPVVTITQTDFGSPVATTNLTVSGKATDSLSGVETLTAQLDAAPAVPVPLDPSGVFRFTTSLPLDGTADGLHTVAFRRWTERGTSRVWASAGLHARRHRAVVTILDPDFGSPVATTT